MKKIPRRFSKSDTDNLVKTELLLWKIAAKFNDNILEKAVISTLDGYKKISIKANDDLGIFWPLDIEYRMFILELLKKTPEKLLPQIVKIILLRG